MDPTSGSAPESAPAGGLAVEIAVQSVEGARIARHHGATRVELCQGLALGGLTPSIGAVTLAVADAREAGAADIHVLIRPRPGDFVYSRTDRRVMERDVSAFRELGAAGVVIGALTEDGSLDRRTLEDLIRAAGDMTVTFHRALDIAEGGTALISQLEDLVNDRIDNHDDRVVMANDPDLPVGTIGMSSWTRVLNMSVEDYDEDVVEDFIGTHSCRFDPEGFC